MKPSLAGITILKVHRASIGGQQVTAVDSSAHQSRVSYLVCVKKDPSQDEDDEDVAPGDHYASIYGIVLGLYKNDGTNARLLEIERYDIVAENKDRTFGYERVDMAKKRTMLLPLGEFRHKVQFFQAPDMQSTAIVMNQCSLMGKCSLNNYEGTAGQAFD